MLSYVEMRVADGHCLSGVGEGGLIVQVEDQQDVKHNVQLPARIVPGLGRHVFSGGTATTKGL